MKKKALIIAFISVLLMSAVAGTFFKVTKANPAYRIIGHHDPDAETEPPNITINSPKNGTKYSSNLDLSFIVNVGESETAYKTMILKVYYESDWLPNEIYLLDSYTHSNEYALIVGDYPSNYIGNVDLSDIPNGKHTITVCTLEYGLYVVDESVFWFHSFSMEASAEIQINKLADSIDVIGVFITETEPPPLVSISSLENKTYNTSDITLNFTVNEVVSSIKYSLDGGANVTITGNTTLTGLPNGAHNITVYVTDETRNTGTAETAFFTIEMPESFPAVLVATASGVSVVIIIAVLLLYFRKHKHLVENDLVKNP